MIFTVLHLLFYFLIICFLILLLCLYDFDYFDDPDLWDAQINEILCSDFPYFTSIGNHDELEWDGYQEKLQNRLTKFLMHNV